ncbi:CotH kinase family protein, partial [Akkermansiaceae bacterium]|nr:CotH kinase family protein [Akkermansiaceae bacterium]
FEGESKQVNAGVVRFGGAFTNFAKRSIRLHFRSEYGPSRLKFPLYDGHDYKTPPVENFDALDLRAGNHDMVARGAYLSNRFTDDSMLDMGQIAPHGRFVHLYFNGNYRGQYHVRERWAAAMLASYFPG